MNDQDYAFSIRINNNEQLDSVINNLNPDLLRKMRLIFIRYPIPEKDSETMLRQYKKQATRVGALDATERVALVDIDGKTYVIPFSFLKYKQGWFLDGFTCFYANIVTVTEMTKEEFLNSFPE